MIRTIIVLCFVFIGSWYSLYGPYYALLFYVWNAYFRPENWLWNNILAGLNLSFVIGVYLIFSTLLSGKKLIFNGHIFLISIFLVQTFVSSLYSSFFDYSFPYWVEFFKVITVGYLMVVLIDDFSKLRKLLLVIALSLGFEGAKQGWYYLATSPGWPNPNPLPFLGDNNGVALGMLMVVPLIILLAQTTPHRWARFFYVFLLIGVVYRALSTYSRGGFLTCVVLAIMYCFQANRRMRAFLAVLSLVLLIIPVLPDSFWDRMRTIETYQEDEDASALGRLHYWQVAILMAENHPILGVGFNAYNPSYDGYDFSKGQYGYQRSVHSSFFGVLAELGYPGLVFYVMILLMALHSCTTISKYSSSKLTPLSSEILHFKLTASAVRIGLVAFLVGGSFLPFQYQEMLWHYIFITLVLKNIALRKKVSQNLDNK
jgi:putative inorganic carbon (hco3(-)) transporter